MTRPRKPRAKAGGEWKWIPAGKFASIIDIELNRKRSREAMRRFRANLKLKEAGSGKAAE